MKLRHIEVFHSIYTTGSITKAAQLLHVSQPSVSKVLAQAETQLGFALFHRAKGKLIATEEALMLVPDINKAYQHINDVRSIAQNIKKAQKGHINIGLTPALGFDVFPDTVAQFHHQHPKISITLQTLHNDTLMNALTQGKIHFACLFSPSALPGVTAISLGWAQLVAMYPKNSFPAPAQSMTLEQIAQLPLISISDSGPLGNLITQRMDQDLITIESNLQVQTYFLAARMVGQNMGVAIVDEFTAKGNLATNVAMAQIEPAIEFELKVLHLTDKPLSTLALEFIKNLQQVFNLGHHSLGV